MFSCHFQETCTITYQYQPLNYGVNGYLYAVALQIEDFVGYTSNSQPLSSIPLQFLVHVSNGSCQTGSRPVFSGDTFPDQSCITVPYGSRFTTNITVLAQDNSRFVGLMFDTVFNRLTIIGVAKEPFFVFQILLTICMITQNVLVSQLCFNISVQFLCPNTHHCHFLMKLINTEHTILQSN